MIYSFQSIIVQSQTIMANIFGLTLLIYLFAAPTFLASLSAGATEPISACFKVKRNLLEKMTDNKCFFLGG